MSPRTDLRYCKTEHEMQLLLSYLHSKGVPAWKTEAGRSDKATFGKYCVHVPESHRKKAEELREKFNLYIRGQKYLRDSNHVAYREACKDVVGSIKVPLSMYTTRPPAMSSPIESVRTIEL